MRVDGLVGIRVVKPAKPIAQPQGSPVFDSLLDLDEATAPPAPASPAAPAPLLAAAPPPPPDAPEIADQRARRHGSAMLEALAALQLATLQGGRAQILQTLADLALTLPEASHPGLQAALQAIAVRAAVESARDQSSTIRISDDW